MTEVVYHDDRSMCLDDQSVSLDENRVTMRILCGQNSYFIGDR